MGLIPLTLKDIAWPERRLIRVTKRLPVVVEVLVWALGLVPPVTQNKEETKKKSGESNYIVKAAWKQGRAMAVFWIAVFSILLFASYAGLVIMQIFSKRSALGCPFPVFMAAWYVVALIPAAIHAIFADLERKKKIISAVQGADEDWPVQLAWGVYYIAGTLVFTSIMAVTVVELVIWVGLGFGVTGTSKLLAFFLCLVFEKTKLANEA
ncbi:hypothetical protein CC78DRAFT_592855 [Lojkania enalia]|uniref:Uncharacterized protein n=1 Tax=Lojkania enalia TaxID=147567 RepID=A0A9P4JZ49_9PLEO|nr:hypothetical protein CC78DRAFT_592855 [Didymosphaeria enalia]